MRTRMRMSTVCNEIDILNDQLLPAILKFDLLSKLVFKMIKRHEKYAITLKIIVKQNLLC